MAAAARLLRWSLLILCFTADFRPISTTGRRENICEGVRTGFLHSDGACRTSSVRGLDFPVWQILVHYGCIEPLTNRAKRRRCARQGHDRRWHSLALQPLLLHGMLTTCTPLDKILVRFCTDLNVSEEKVFSTFVGSGLYLFTLLLTMGDVESNPGPEFSPEQIDQLAALLDSKLGDIKTAVNGLVAKVDDQSNRVEKLTAENVKLTSRVTQLESRLATHEMDLRRKNVLVFGVPTATEVDQALEDVIFKRLGLSRRPKSDFIESAFQIGKQDGAKRPILIRFRTAEDKSAIMRKAFKLKDTGISISDDLTPNERKDRRVLVEAQKSAKSLKLNTRLRRRGLEVEGELLSAENVSKKGWMRKFVPQPSTEPSGEEEAGESEVQSDGDGRPQKKRTKKRNRHVASLSPNEAPVEPEAGPSQTDFITAPLNSNQLNKKQTKAVVPRGRPATSLDRLARTRSAANSSQGSDAEQTQK
jgi:hypothetical protein